MSFDLGESAKGVAGVDAAAYYERKTCGATASSPDEKAYQNDIVVPKDLFETISEAHYLPELSGPHDEALLESLVEKGCEDNQILGQALDKLAHLVHTAPDYGDEEEDMLLSGAPVADIIHRLEQSLESPGRSSMTAAQGLLHLHHIADHLPPPEHGHHPDNTHFLTAPPNFDDQPADQCVLDTLADEAQLQEKPNDMYEQGDDKELEDSHLVSAAMLPVTEPETNIEDKNEGHQQQDTFPDQSDGPRCDEIVNNSTDIDRDNSAEAVIPSIAEETDGNSVCEETSNTHDDTDFNLSIDFDKEIETSNNEEMVPTDLSIKNIERTKSPPRVVASAAETTNSLGDNLSDKSDEQPKDLSFHRRLPTPHASPRRLDIPRAPSRESDAMQSPQPSGIPAVPSSPELFSMPQSKNSKSLFLETLLSSPSPKMYTSEVTITKQQCEPLNLGKHRKSASPTVSSCSDEIKKLTREFGEPQEKRIKRESAEELAKISKVFAKGNDDVSESKQRKSDRHTHKSCDETSPLKQLQVLKTSPDFNIPDPLLVPKDKLNDIITAPGREIPALLIQRPELRLPEAFAFPAILQDPDILVISLSQLENILENNTKKQNLLSSPKPKEGKHGKSTSSSEPSQFNQPDGQPKPIPSMDALAGDIDAATSAALNQMLWLPYLSQLEAAVACSQNMDFLKALNSSGYSGHNYPELSQMFSPSSRFINPANFPMMPSMDYDNRLQFAMWQEAMSHASATAQRSKHGTDARDVQLKEIAKASDVQNPYVHSTKNYPSKSHTSARTSPIAHNYNGSCQRSSANHNPFLQGMYPNMNSSARGGAALSGLQIPYLNASAAAAAAAGNQRLQRGHAQQKGPTSPYFQNNNYLPSVKHSETSAQAAAQLQRGNSAQGASGGSGAGSGEVQRPRISVKSLQNLLEPGTAGAPSASRRQGRRRDEPEVGSTTPLGEAPIAQHPPHPHLPHHLPPHPHDPIHHLWHPLFGNQKGYNSPWSWTTVTATGD